MTASRLEMESMLDYWTSAVIPKSTVTIVTLVLKSGYQVTGEAACTKPENFNEQRGIELALDKAYNKLATLLEFYSVQATHDEMVKRGLA